MKATTKRPQNDYQIEHKMDKKRPKNEGDMKATAKRLPKGTQSDHKTT
jgi:hypothetical protein